MALWPSGWLLRNWWWKLLKGNELQIERLSLFFEPFNALESEFLFIMLDAFFDIVFSVAQHAIDYASQMMGHSDDGLWSAKSGSQAAVLGSEGAFAMS